MEEGETNEGNAPPVHQGIEAMMSKRIPESRWWQMKLTTAR